MASESVLKMRKGDEAVYQQIFVQDEYAFDYPAGTQYIMDLGGHIGLASRWYKRVYPKASIMLVEPDTENWQMAFHNAGNILCINGAVASKAGPQLLMEEKDEGPWAYRTSPVMPDSDAHKARRIVHGYTVPDLMEMANFPRIDILKMDIEGAEWDVLLNENKWLMDVRSVVVELHEYIHPGVCNVVRAALADYGLEWETNLGENSYFRRSDED